MPRERVVLVEDEPEHSLAIWAGLQRQGFQVEVVTSVAEAVSAARNGVDKFVYDIRLKDDPKDCTGLLFIKPVLAEKPSACVVVCSAIARAYREVALELGAYAVVAKSRDLHSTVLELENHFLRFDAGRRTFGFAVNWILAPLVIGAAASWVRFRVPFLTSLGSDLFPLALAALFVLIAADRKGRKDSVIAAWSVFKKFQTFRIWLFAAIVGGLLYDVVKNFFLVGG
jgi:CheY-like chemotaxis protein